MRLQTRQLVLDTEGGKEKPEGMFRFAIRVAMSQLWQLLMAVGTVPLVQLLLVVLLLRCGMCFLPPVAITAEQEMSWAHWLVAW